MRVLFFGLACYCAGARNWYGVAGNIAIIVAWEIGLRSQRLIEQRRRDDWYGR